MAGRLAAVVTTSGLEILVPTIVVSSAFATTASLGALGIVLSPAAGNAGGTGGSSDGYVGQAVAGRDGVGQHRAWRAGFAW